MGSMGHYQFIVHYVIIWDMIPICERERDNKQGKNYNLSTYAKVSENIKTII